MLRDVAFIRRFLLLALATGLSLRCATARPPVEQGSFHKPELVELIRLDPTIHLDIRYATANNIVHRPVYRQARAFLQRSAAQALVRVHRTLSEKGYGLLVFDGYRPWSVTKIFWDSVRPEQRAFVADPKKGSKHNRACAVDLSLYDRATGKEVEMPSAYDETSERASPSYAGGTPEQSARRDLLRSAMEKEGFTVEPNEWWHFNYKDWREYPILDIPFEKIREDSGSPANQTKTPSKAHAARMVITGQGAVEITRAATLPRKKRETPLRPCVPMTTRSAPLSLAASAIAS